MLRLLNSINDLIDFMPNQFETSKYRHSNELFIKTKEIIESVIAFKDDTFQIMKCLYPRNVFQGKREPIFADKWVESINKVIIEDYKRGIKFLDNLNYINNKIKHNNGRLSFFHIKAMNCFNIIGFFLNGVDDKGIKQPDEYVHPKFKGMNTGYSYNYLIPLSLAYAYLVSDYASKAILKIINDFHGEKVIISSFYDNSDNIISLIGKINRFITKILLPDEYKRDFPEIQLDNTKLKIIYPADNTFLKKFIKYESFKAELIQSGDGFTTQFKIPYW